MKAKHRTPILALTILVALMGGTVASFTLTRATSHGTVEASSPPASPDIAQGKALLESLSQVFESAAAKVSPSVVPIFSEQTVEVQTPFGPEGDPFRQFFGEDFFHRFFGESKQTVRGLGSGVIMSPDGYILTNNHVVNGAQKLTVVLSDKRKLPAKVVGTDPQTDVAVIKVDANDLPAAQLGNSDDVKVGQWVIAVGNPFELMHTVTSGIISAKGRSSVGLAEYEDFIQTDASINPGNSGGALADLEGNVIGINTAISSPSGGNVGIGFAIPINMAKKVMDTLITHGKVSRGYLGVMLQNVDPSLAKALKLGRATGVLVADVQPNGPADRAGLKRGDVIETLNGKQVTDTVQIRNEVAQTAPGAQVHLAVVRDGQPLDVTAVLGERPSETPGPAGQGETPEAPTTSKLGLSIQPLTPDLARQLGYENQRGVLVADVEAGSPADDAGIGRGDLIQEVNRTPIGSVRDFMRVIAEARSGDSIALLVRRGPNTFYAAITIP